MSNTNKLRKNSKLSITNQLTLRQLKNNKKRTLITIIGVILSVAMVTAVAISMTSALDLLKRVAISEEGNWHMKFYDVESKDLGIIEEGKNVSTIIISHDLGYSALDEVNNRYKPYLFVKAFNEAGFSHMPIQLTEGRMPQNSSEIVIPKSLIAMKGTNYQIGDTITLEIGDRYIISEQKDETNSLEITVGEATEETEERVSSEIGQNYSLSYNDEGELDEAIRVRETKTYTITGIIEKPGFEYSWSPGYTLITFLDEEALQEHSKVEVAVQFDPINKEMYQIAKSIGDELGLPAVEPHSELLVCYGVNSSRISVALLGVVTIIMLIIIGGSVSLIYNAFAISVSERSQYLGMLASVGATRKQKRNSVFFEGVVIGAISIPLGLLAGFFGMWVTFGFVNEILENVIDTTEGLRIVVSPLTIVVAVVISVLTIFISTYIPARRASKVSAIEAIRQTQDNKINEKRVKTSRLTRKIFGFEGELALKNLKRNGKRYRATLFSLIVSIVLFLATSTFSSYTTKSLDMMLANTNYDLSVASFKKEPAKRIAALKALTKNELIKDYSILTSACFETYMSEAETADFIKEMQLYDEQNKGYSYWVELIMLEDNAFDAYAKTVGADIASLKNTDRPAGIILNIAKYRDKTTKQYQEEAVIYSKVGDKIALSGYEYEEETDTHHLISYGEIEIGVLTKELPLGVDIQEDSNEIKMIVSREVYNALVSEKMQQESGSYSQRLFIKTDEPYTLQNELLDIEKVSGIRQFSINNIYEQQERSQQMQTLMKIFVYGFITLITAISIANILNTISTSIALRKREFAMLRSVGMTPKGFNKMINFESIFYGLKALLYGLPISFGIMVILYRRLSYSFNFSFYIPMGSVLVVIVSVFLIVGLAMFYSGAKVKGQNIIESLKDTNL